jgi:hypothetical protein
MPPQRTLMGEISGNRPDYAHLTPYMRGKITGMRIFGSNPTEIAIDLNQARSTVRYTLSHNYLRHEGSTLLKDPRRKSYSLAKERNLLQHVRLNPKDTYKQIKTVCALIYSTGTIKRILKKYSICNWRAKRWLLFTEKYVAKRLA